MSDNVYQNCFNHKVQYLETEIAELYLVWAKSDLIHHIDFIYYH